MLAVVVAVRATGGNVTFLFAAIDDYPPERVVSVLQSSENFIDGLCNWILMTKYIYVSLV